MKPSILILAAAVLAAGCGSWGGYKFKSDRFHFEVTFPEKWEVWDRSSDAADFLQATIPEAVPDAEIKVRAIPTAPDLSPSEVYPSFLDGSEYADRVDFRIDDKDAVSCANTEGRFIKFSYLKEMKKIRGMKALFLGNRFMVEIVMEMPETDFIVHETEFRKMISLVRL